MLSDALKQRVDRGTVHVFVMILRKNMTLTPNDSDYTLMQLQRKEISHDTSS